MIHAKAFVFDAYGTLFDTRSVLDRCEEVFPGHGAALTTLWRSKQLEYSWLRSLIGRYEDFWQLTRDGLAYACQSLGLAATDEQIKLGFPYIRFVNLNSKYFFDCFECI